MENKELNEKVASLLQSGDRQALAEMIVEYVQPNHLTQDFVGMLLNTRTLNPGDSLVKKLRKGIEVRTLMPGSIHLASEITVSDRINYVLDGWDVKTTWNEWELDNGEIGTVEDIRAEMIAKVRDYHINKVYTALSTIWTAINTPSNYVSMGTAITSTALEDAINQINQTTTGAKAVIGSRVAMTPITKFGAFWSDGTNVTASDPAVEEIRQTGLLGKYYGVPLVVINQVYDNPEDYTPLIPTDKILVIGENVGDYITYGPEKTKQWQDMRPTPPQWFLEIYGQSALLIWNALGIYVIGNLV